MRRSEIDAYEVFCGIDVGKTSNYAVVLDRFGDAPLIRRSLAQDEAEIRSLLAEVSALGRPLVTVDQFGTFGRLVVAVAERERASTLPTSRPASSSRWPRPTTRGNRTPRTPSSSQTRRGASRATSCRLQPETTHWPR